jgi:hypothetical protein
MTRPTAHAHTFSKALLLGALAISIFPSSAHAATRLPFDKTAWFWSSNQDVTTCTAPPSPAPPVCGGGSASGGIFGNGGGTVSPISPGHMGVAMKNGSSDMRSYIKVDTSAIPPGSKIESFVVTLTVSQPDQNHTPEHAKFAQSGQGHAPATVNASAASIVACAVKQPFGDNMAGGGGGDPPYSTTVTPATDSPDQQTHVDTTKNEPFSDCSLNAGGAPSSDGKTWSFDITNIAQAWSDGTIYNEGIALLPQNTSVDPTWTIEFHGNPLSLPGKNESLPDTEFVSKELAGFATVEFVAGDGSETSVPPPVTSSYVPPPPPLIDTGPIPPPVDNTNTGTDVQGEKIARPPVTTTAVAFVGATPGWVFGIFPLLLIGLALLARTIGFDPIGLGFSAQSSRVAAVLHARRLGGEAPVAATEAIKSEELEGK